MATGEFSIGPNKWTPAMGSCAIKYKSDGEFKDVKADGKNDARKTWLGRKTGEVDITCESQDDTRPGSDVDGLVDTLVRNFIRPINPRGPDGGKAFAWNEADQDLHQVYNVTVDALTTARPPGSGKLITTIKLSSWTKPAVTAPTVTKTPTVAAQWAPGAKKPQPPGAPPKNFTTTPPVVKP